jgi:hypothetical protein
MTERRTSAPAVWLIVVALCLPAAYVLSFGPAVRLHDAGYLPSAIRWVYEPLNWLCHVCTPFRYALHWYVGLWGG